MEISRKDRETLRTLAKRYMEYASRPAEAEKRKLWHDLNTGSMRRPMVVMDQLPWSEMDVDGSLVCTVEDPVFRAVECELRRRIYRAEHMPADDVQEPVILISRPVRDTGYGIEIRETTLKTEGRDEVVSHAYVNQFETLEDVAKIKDPVITLDRAYENEIFSLADDIFAGIAPVQKRGICMHLGLWDKVAMWMSVEDIYYDLIDEPELLHAVMDRLTDATLAAIRQINAIGAYDVTSHRTHCSYIYSDDLPGASCDPERPTSADGWGFGLAQLFSSVSPATTKEFEVPYMQRLFPHFGAIYYGCCDRLDDRLDIVTEMPRIRKISCSPWSDREAFAERLPKHIIMSSKPTPSYLAGDSFDEDAVRSDLRRTTAAAKANGIGLEMILKDVSTCCRKPERLWRWNEIALEEAQRAAL